MNDELAVLDLALDLLASGEADYGGAIRMAVLTHLEIFDRKDEGQRSARVFDLHNSVAGLVSKHGGPYIDGSVEEYAGRLRRAAQWLRGEVD